MQNNINKYLNDINLNLITYYNVPNTSTIAQYDFQALDSNNEIVIGSIFFSFKEIDIKYITKEGTKHLYSCMIKHSSINDHVINTTHSIIKGGAEKVIDAMTLENIPQQDFFNFNLSNDMIKQKTKVLANY